MFIHVHTTHKTGDDWGLELQDSSVGHLRAGHGASAPSAPRSASGALSGIAGITAVATVGLAVSSRSAKAGARGNRRFFLGKI